jgi:hypothetical protein
MRILILLLLLTFITGPVAGADNGPAFIGDGVTIQGIIWEDSNCDGLRQEGEPRFPTIQSLSLFYIGDDDIAFTPDDTEVGVGGGGGSYYEYAFSISGGGGGANHRYYIAIRPRYRNPGYLPGPWQQGTDPTIDNDLRLWPDGTWATGIFIVPNGAGVFLPAVNGIDLGMCPGASIPRPFYAALPFVQR